MIKLAILGLVAYTAFAVTGASVTIDADTISNVIATAYEVIPDRETIADVLSTTADMLRDEADA